MSDDLPNAHEDTPDRAAVAATWLLRMGSADCTHQERAEFEAWLAAAPANRAAAASVERAWRFVASHAADPEFVVMRCDALRRAQNAARGRWRSGRRGGLFQPRLLAACAAAAAALAVAVFVTHGSPYSTAQGERRAITLSDGSHVFLDEDTRLRVRFSRHARSLWLERGQARFDVAHDTGRPFSVTAGRRKVIATGTAFNVDLLDSKLFVTLIEGRVAVHPSDPFVLSYGRNRLKAAPVELIAGQEFVERTDGGQALVAKVDTREMTAWQNGKLVFDNEPLLDAVARVNRYAGTKIVVDGAVAGSLKVNGVFNTGDPRAFVEGVTAYLPVEAVVTPGGSTELHAISRR